MSSEDVVMDFGRPERIGLEEAVFSAGKTPEQIATAIGLARERGVGLLLTRLDAEKYAALPAEDHAEIDYDPLSRTGVFGPLREIATRDRIAIVVAGTSDMSVAGEAERALRYAGHEARMIADVGVAGLWRLTSRLTEIRACPVTIVVAGMDAALASVVGGLVSGPVIAVPTSVGYGVATGGVTALHAMLASCAPGLTVTNIDNGYGAACAALRYLQAAGRMAGG